MNEENKIVCSLCGKGELPHLECNAVMNQPNNRIREEWRNKLRDFDYTNHRGQGLEDFIDELLKSQREELVEKIEKMWNYPCNCSRKQLECKHNYDTMFAVLSLIKEE